MTLPVTIGAQVASFLTAALWMPLLPLQVGSPNTRSWYTANCDRDIALHVALFATVTVQPWFCRDVCSTDGEWLTVAPRMSACGPDAWTWEMVTRVPATTPRATAPAASDRLVSTRKRRLAGANLPRR